MSYDEPGESPASGAVPLPPPLPVVRKAAWWAWPLVFFALIPFDKVAGWFVEEPGRTTKPPVASASDLALLKLQAQIVIASAKIDPSSSREALDDLAGMVSGDRAVAALALLECFIDPASPGLGSLLERFSGDSGDLAGLTDEAVREGVGEEDRERLRDRLGWFAELARGPGLAPSPQEGEIKARSFIVLAVLGLLVTGVCLALLSGAVLLVLHWRRVRADARANAFVPSTRHGGVLLECFALYLGIMTAGALVSAWLGVWAAIVCSAAAVVVPLLWPRWWGLRWADFRAAIGLHRGRGWWREIGAGFVGYFGVLAIASIGIAMTLALTLIAGLMAGGGGDVAGGGGGAPPGPQAHPVVGWIYEGGLWMKLACLALAAGFAPVFEEIFFRGALQRYFRGRFRFFASALFASLIFAALHPQGFFAIPALAGMGIGFSLLREWRDSLIAPMTAHAINNGSLVAMLWWIL